MTDERTPSQLIDERIDELGDWRGENLARIRAVIQHVVSAGGRCAERVLRPPMSGPARAGL